MTGEDATKPISDWTLNHPDLHMGKEKWERTLVNPKFPAERSIGAATVASVPLL